MSLYDFYSVIRGSNVPSADNQLRVATLDSVEVSQNNRLLLGLLRVCTVHMRLHAAADA